jgi:hypothetical protein
LVQRRLRPGRVSSTSPSVSDSAAPPHMLKCSSSACLHRPAKLQRRPVRVAQIALFSTFSVRLSVRDSAPGAPSLMPRTASIVSCTHPRSPPPSPDLSPLPRQQSGPPRMSPPRSPIAAYAYVAARRFKSDAKLRACALGSASPSPTPSSPSDHGVRVCPMHLQLRTPAHALVKLASMRPCPRQTCSPAPTPSMHGLQAPHTGGLLCLLAVLSATAREYTGSSSSTPPCSCLRLRSLQAHPRLLCSAPSTSSTSQCSLRRTLQTNSVSSGTFAYDQTINFGFSLDANPFQYMSGLSLCC